MTNGSGEITQWTADFNGNKTLFVSQKEEFTDYYVGTKSLVVGMGLSWGAQYMKIKSRFGNFVKEIPISKGLVSKVCLLNERLLPDFLGTIETYRVAEGARDRVYEYKENFIDFVNKETANENLTIFDSYIESGLEGIQRLVKDVAKMDYTLGHERIAEILHELMTNPELTLSELRLSNKVHDIADHLAKNQNRLRI